MNSSRSKIAHALETQKLLLAGTDIEISAILDGSKIIIEIMKGGACIHILQINDATDTIEQLWLADMFARKDILEVRDLGREVDEFLLSTNTNQG